MALGLVRAGARVAIVASGPSVQLDETFAQLDSLGARSQVVSALGDLRDPSSCDRIVSDVLAAFGKIEVLINNAGVPDDASRRAIDDCARLRQDHQYFSERSNDGA